MRLPRIALALAVVVALLASGCQFDGAYDLPLPGSPVDEGNSYEVTAEFADILNIVPKSPVMVDDVTVGEVTDVQRVGWHAKITMRVRNDVELPDNAIAGSATTTTSRSPRPAATRRSRRSSGRCPSCSAVAASVSSGRSPRS